MAVQASSPADLGSLNQAPVSHGNVEAMIAAMCSENFKLNKEAQPTEKQQIVAQIEKALSESINSTDFEANKEFWESLKDSLPKDSPLLSFAEAETDLFTNNSSLKQLEDRYASDEAIVQKGWNGWTDSIQDLITYNNSKADEPVVTSQIHAEEHTINLQSKSLSQENEMTASSVLNLAQQANNTASQQMAQTGALEKTFAALASKA